MKHRLTWFVVALSVTLAVPALRADVKTREKVQFRLEGIMGGMMRLFGGSAARDGVTSTIALKGQRLAVMGDATGEIIDLGREVVLRVDIKKKEFRVVTFEQLRKEWQEMQEKAKEDAEELKKAQSEAAEDPGKEYEFTAEVKETGQRKSIAGYDTREVILTITGKEKGKSLEDGGGFVMTNTMWLAPRIAALDEVTAFQMRYLKAIAGDEGAAQMQQLATAVALYPAMKPMMDTMRAESAKLQGTALVTNMLFETVKSAAQMKAGSDQSAGGGGGGGGLSGRLAGRIMGGRGGGQSSGPRSTVFSTVRELLSVETSATEADVEVPAGFKEKK